MYHSLVKLCDTSQSGHVSVKQTTIKFPSGQITDGCRFVKEQVLGQCPCLGDIVIHVLSHIQVRSKW